MATQLPASFELLVRRRRWVASTFAALPALAGVSYFVWRSVAFGNAGLSMQAAIFGVLLSFGVFRQLGGRYEMMTVRADERGLRIGKRWVPHAQIRAALSGPGPAPRVVLKLRWSAPVELLTGSEAEAQTLLEALGHDPSEHEAVFVGPSRLFAGPGGPASLPGAAFAVWVTAALFHHFAPEAARFGVPPVFAIIVIALLVPTRIAIGKSGIAARWLGTRTAAWSEVVDVERDDWKLGNLKMFGLRVITRETSLRLPIALRIRWFTNSPAKLALIEERIRQGMDRSS